ncbi:helix-turn-helix transcriptional regulator [Paenibacillus sp. AN1007]|uniref:Helix-turn-helix transcriptional regulator n=1 Tax=Paenibacillus sp. AN1007 TaxID=3151385 RepID=A0AAU8NGK4_9BACL
MRINKKIRALIKQRGLTFTYVADKSDIQFKKFSRMMTSRQKIGTDEYERICTVLGVAPGYFFEEKFLENKKGAS